MFARGLRAKIAVNIAILLFMAMLSIDLITLVTTKRYLVRSEVSRADLIMSHLKYNLLQSESVERDGRKFMPAAHIIRIIMDSNLTAAVMLGVGNAPAYYGDNRQFSFDDLTGFTKEAMTAGRQTTNFIGNTMGIFWNQKANLCLSAPLIKDGVTIGGISIVMSLESIYKTLRKSQNLLLIYTFINLAILTFVGIYKISKLYLQPLFRLAKRAEDYEEDDEFIFSVRKEDNELNRLSKALNSMLKRISADKKMLRSTVLSLEKANLELKKAQREVIRAEKLASVGRLSAGIAHEIGNPIGIVMGYLDLLKQSDITEDERIEYIQRTEEEIERINTIIRQLLEVSRPSNSGRMEVAVHNLIHDTADVLRVQPLMSNIELSLNLEAHNHTVWADPNQLRQVFLNLIINAADAMSSQDKDAAGKLNISTEIDEGSDPETDRSLSYLKISFIDDGAGIAEESLGNIFDPFFTTKDPGKGTGLGLSVSFMIVESLGGKMTGVSQEGMGTTIIIYLPLCTSKLHQQQSSD